MFYLFGLKVTGEVITMWGIIAVIAVISFVSTRKLKERPGKFQNIIEYCIEYIENLINGILGREKGEKYYTFLASLFIFIIVSNYTGVLPGVGRISGFSVPSASLSVTLGLGVCAFFGTQYFALKKGGKHFVNRFIKPVAFIAPLLILDEFIKPASLALRLYGNVFGEESVTEQLYELLPVGAPLIMMALSLLFCYIQAVVFTMLTSIYIDEATE